jgi:urea carboxylase
LIQGKLKLEIETETFSLKQYQEFLQSNADEITTFKTKQQTAFQAERDRWAAAGEFSRQEALDEVESDEAETAIELPANAEAVLAHVSANVWQVLVKPGDRVAEGDRLVILEAMKMEIAVTADAPGTVVELYCTQGQTVTAGQVLLAIAGAGE